MNASSSTVVMSKSRLQFGGQVGFAESSAGVKSRVHWNETPSRPSWLQYFSSPLFGAPGVGSIFASVVYPTSGSHENTTMWVLYVPVTNTDAKTQSFQYESPKFTTFDTLRAEFKL